MNEKDCFERCCFVGLVGGGGCLGGGGEIAIK